MVNVSFPRGTKRISVPHFKEASKVRAIMSSVCFSLRRAAMSSSSPCSCSTIVRRDSSPPRSLLLLLLLTKWITTTASSSSKKEGRKSSAPRRAAAAVVAKVDLNDAAGREASPGAARVRTPMTSEKSPSKSWKKRRKNRGGSDSVAANAVPRCREHRRRVGETSQSNVLKRRAILFAGDVAAFSVFATIGRASHGEGLNPSISSAAGSPFILGWASASYLLGTQGAFGDSSRRSGVDKLGKSYPRLGKPSYSASQLA